MTSIETFFHKEKNKLSSFVYRMTKNTENTEDLVQETLLTAIEKQKDFNQDASFKTWIFSIATNKTIDFLRKESRWADNVMDKAKQNAMSNPDFFGKLKSINNNSPHGAFEVKEHINLCFTCIAKTLVIESQVALILKDVYGFKVKEIAQIIGRSVSQVKHDLEHARNQMIEIFDKRCALINKKGVCNQCSELNQIFNPKQHIAAKKNEINFMKNQASKSKKELYALRTDLVAAIDPLNSEGHEFQKLHLDFICEVAKK